MGRAKTHAGRLPSGSNYRLEVPAEWNGTLLARPIPVGEDEPAWEDGEPLVGRLVGDPVPASFFAFEPRPFPRPYDARHAHAPSS